MFGKGVYFVEYDIISLYLDSPFEILDSTTPFFSTYPIYSVQGEDDDLLVYTVTSSSSPEVFPPNPTPSGSPPNDSTPFRSSITQVYSRRQQPADTRHKSVFS